MDYRNTTLEPTRRFSSRVDDYVRYRPGYPAALLSFLKDETGLCPQSIVADVGSGTGISAELFLRLGCTVFAVEPNAEMRRAAEERLGANPRFHGIDGTAEATTLPAAGVDFVVVAQAFHWFDPIAARAEFARILGPAGWVVLIWNVRRTESGFLREYEAVLHRFGTDYAAVDHRNVDSDALSQFFRMPYHTRTFYNEQLFDLEGLKGRVRSSSYAPSEEHPDHGPMMRELERLFDLYAEDGRVRFVYDTELHFGRLN